MTWSEAHAKLGDSGLLLRFEESRRIVFVKVSVVAIVGIGLGAAFAASGSATVNFDAARGVFTGVARVQSSDTTARVLHLSIAQALGLA